MEALNTPRAGKITFLHPPKPEAVAIALTTIQRALDAADDGVNLTVSAYLGFRFLAPDESAAWVAACLLIADKCDIDSMTLQALRTSIWKGAQDALFG